MLFLLGIDSAFSLMEGCLTIFYDAKSFRNVPRQITSGVLIVVAFLFSLMYATDAGLIFLDAVDYYVSVLAGCCCCGGMQILLFLTVPKINFVMLLVGCFECFAVGYIYRIEDQVASLGAEVVSSYVTTTVRMLARSCAFLLHTALTSLLR